MIPFNRPLIVERSLDYLEPVLANLHLSGDGPFTKKCQALLEKQLGVPKALLTTSCTDALEMAALLLDIQPGDEVIVPDFTFVSTVNAFVLRAPARSSRTFGPTRSISTSNSWRSTLRRGPRRLCRSITPASAASLMRSCASQPGTA